MRRIIQTILFFLLMPLMVSCGSPNENAYHGYLYFAKGSYLMRFSLRDGSLSVETNLGNKKIREISRFGEDRLLISELEPVNRKEVARISWLDLETGQSEALYSGFRARYIDNARVIIYDDSEKLYSVYLAGDSEIDSVILAHKRNKLSAMVVVSGDRLLFEVIEDGQPVIYNYQPKNGDLVTLDQLAVLCRLDGAVWIRELEQLACRKRDKVGDDAAGNYILAGLEGNSFMPLNLPEGEKFLALAYIDNQGVLILGESWQSKFGGKANSAVWAHDIRSGENYRLSDSQNLGTSVVYTDY